MLLALSEQGLRNELDRFCAARDHAGMKISTEKTEAKRLSRKPGQCTAVLFNSGSAKP